MYVTAIVIYVPAMDDDLRQFRKRKCFRSVKLRKNRENPAVGMKITLTFSDFVYQTNSSLYNRKKENIFLQTRQLVSMHCNGMIRQGEHLSVNYDKTSIKVLMNPSSSS